MRNFAVPLFLGAQMMLAYWAAGPSRLPAMPDRSAFPAALGDWHLLGDEPVDAALISQLGADQVIHRDYSSAGIAANVFVAWYQWQQEGSRQTHSPLVCLPASGWVTDRAEQTALETSAGTIQVNRLAIRSGAQRGSMLYWYQTPRRTITGEWAQKFWLIESAVRDRRTDAAFVRVFVSFGEGGGPAASSAAESIARSLYPRLREYLPR